MKPAAFAYHRPRSSEEVLALLAEHGDEGKILAGGQSLVAAMNFRLARPASLIDINEAADLKYVRDGNDGFVRIGALTRHADFHKPIVASPLGTLTHKVVQHIAHYPIRQRGTFCGSLAHADPASEWCLVATTLGAEVTLRSARGERVVKSDDFFISTFVTATQPDELITEVRLPRLDGGWTSGFSEFSRRAGDFGLATSLAALRIENGAIADARLGIGGVSDKAIRLIALEGALRGQRAAPKLFEEIGQAAAASITPTADIHASSDYRRDLVAVMVRRALAEAAQ